MVTMTKRERSAEARRRFVMPYEKGTILHHSWGFEQTQCDFYQVVEVKKRSVVLKKIEAETIPGSEGMMCDNRTAVKDAFITRGPHALSGVADMINPENPTIEKRVGVYMDEKSELHYYIPTPYGWCKLWDGTPQYCSWYA